MKVLHHGGKDTVTGSCHELQLERGSILVDCGLFQGKDALLGRQNRSLTIEFSLTKVKALVLTHAHIDHIGRLPWLLAAGFRGKIYCTRATAELVPLMLADGLKLQLGLGQQQRQHILNLIKQRLVPCDYHNWISIKGLAYLRFQPAGHILGSAYLEFKLSNNEVVVFSGDLGPSNTPLLPDPIPPVKADYLFIESTYGDKHHESVKSRSTRLLSIIEHALEDGGVIVIPAFSVGRTQELLFDIEQLLYQESLHDALPVILDSPLAREVTKTYRRFKKLWGREAKKRVVQHRHPLGFEQCITIETHAEHMRLVNRLASTSEPAIVVAASGMCEGGRVVNYLEALLPDSRNDVLFAGYQAEGTLGRQIQDGANTVEIAGKQIIVKAQIHTISGYSAHADQSDLIRFVEGIHPPPKEVHLIHGERVAKAELYQHFARKKTNIVL
ncbi:MBL fold metallo-hydrolase RNA specificity domain-containing protein [Vibrio parahaemolyticus]|uniref:MBL fold metallo-hydrolase RNA specificity domain-containing protein n=1 Tax=Vibrio parahaemolyticus TaxID=670 RepID=UPI000649D0E0|nr:MBL fold metallo-hydrolase [Vibrio parahaemolyticus]EGQ8503752.1 MBL fold metallo-hydrolase [Vibrio parahaemolyticus]EGR2724474.1 MBL fold metallo-hydrolase [Vibrio parahaemolyticus]EGS6762221.1 MBL fold metallo-hydrolase [Vibrio parahaemolyticus]EGY8742746.1 MBL fold metallo-hydrolase [Vibrio parahaemolyticus]EHE6934320.1 MBL fold metallo-hydrolase [Vibrio parahaemolyticus]